MTPTNPPDRLTSWKEIAAYVGRDVRTVLRWEKERGLPVHRIPGAKGRVVFAYTHELDAWSRSTPRQPAVEFEAGIDVLLGPENDPSPEVAVPVDSGIGRLPSPRARWWGAATVAAIIIVGAAWILWPRQDSDPLTLFLRPDGIFAVGSDGAKRWRHPFAVNEWAVPLGSWAPEATTFPGTDEPDLLAGTIANRVDGNTLGGRLYRFSRDGDLHHTFTFNDELQFGPASYGGPWVLTTFRVEASGGHRQIAVAAHHFEWWPAMVTILDDQWKRRGTFVNSGWIEALSWVNSERLVIAGFSNSLQGGVIALLAANALDGHSPDAADGQYLCTSCGSDQPLRYLVMPRSEVNRATNAAPNMVNLIVRPNGFIARTLEATIRDRDSPAEVMYEFTKALELVRATYTDGYWDIHRRLEADGRIKHTREQCPDRDGPREILAWEPAQGWVTQAINRPAASASAVRPKP